MSNNKERIIPENVKSNIDKAINLLINYDVIQLEDEIETGNIGFSSSYPEFGRLKTNTKYKVFTMEVKDDSEGI